jgi:hypothetical protein
MDNADDNDNDNDGVDDNDNDNDGVDAINTDYDNRSLQGQSDDATQRNCCPRTNQQQQQNLDIEMSKSDDAIYACIFASTVTKKASELAYAHKKRAMTTPDVIENIGPAFQLLYSETDSS